MEIISEKKAPTRILHVDDDKEFLLVSKEILNMESNFEIDVAYTVDEAFEKMKHQDYEAIISDYEMPEKNGIDFLKELKQRGNDIPFILFTGKGREEVAMQALNLGADGYYNKNGSIETVYGELSHGVKMSIRRKKTEKQLKENEEQLEMIIKNAPIGIVTADSNRRILNANKAACEMIGFSENELRDLFLRDLVHREDLDKCEIKVEELAQNKVNSYVDEARFTRKDGRTIDCRFILTMTKDHDDKPVLFVAEVEDITKQLKATAELEQKYSLFESIGENINAGLVIIDKNYKVVWSNKTLTDLGICQGDLCFKKIAKSENVCPDCGVKIVFEQNLPLHIHEWKTNIEGETVWIELRVTPLRNKNGEIISALELAVPITERKLSEQKTLKNEEQLALLNEKLRVVGNLTRHDARNKLSAIMAYTYILEKMCIDRPKVIDGLNKIELAVRETEHIFKNAKTYEEIGVKELTYINAENALNEAILLFSGPIPKISNELRDLELLADSFLRQLFYNFIDDTIKHGEKATEVKVSYQKYDGYLKLIYEDNGVGIPIDKKPALFNNGPTRTSGTGLGLFLSKKMIDVYGWMITENGEPGRGARFEITIPGANKEGKPNYKILESSISPSDILQNLHT